MIDDAIDSATHEVFACLRRNGQPWVFVRLAVQIAESPDTARDLIRWAVFGEQLPMSLPRRPPLRKWVALYRSHRVMQDAVAAAMGLPGELSASGELDEMRADSRMSQDEIAAEVADFTPEEQRDILRLFIGVPFPPDDPTLRAMLDELDLDAELDDSKEASLFDGVIASPAGQFFFRVWWPCWILYREYPPKLIHAARSGDLDALDRLLRLDKYSVHDAGIARVIGDVMLSGPDNDKKRILNAFKGRPTVRLTDANIRAGLAALISQLVFVFRTKVTAPEIQALFDGIERVRSGAPSDPKITATGEAWSKAVQRGRTWPSLPTGPPGQ